MLEITSDSRPLENKIENISWDSQGNGGTMGKFARLTVIRLIREKGKKTIAVCKCECGADKSAIFSSIKSGGIKSCGCLKRETSFNQGKKNFKHGQAIPSKRGPAYRSWESMKSRCLNENDPTYKHYGLRGITVCDQWKRSFDAFLQDMGERPIGKTLDRIDVNKGYEPENCRWADSKQQGRNRRNNRIVEFCGELMSIAVLSEKTGVPYQRLHERIVRRGWDVSKAISTTPMGFR